MEFSFNAFQLCSHFFGGGKEFWSFVKKILVLNCQVNRNYGCGLEVIVTMGSDDV